MTIKEKFGRSDNAVFLHLDVIVLAIFDAILVFMVFDIQSKKGTDWQLVKRNLYGILNKHKLNRTVEIINDQYKGYDVLFLQEVRNNLMDDLEQNDNLKLFAKTKIEQK